MQRPSLSSDRPAGGRSGSSASSPREVQLSPDGRLLAVCLPSHVLLLVDVGEVGLALRKRRSERDAEEDGGRQAAEPIPWYAMHVRRYGGARALSQCAHSMCHILAVWRVKRDGDSPLQTPHSMAPPAAIAHYHVCMHAIMCACMQSCVLASNRVHTVQQYTLCAACHRQQGGTLPRNGCVALCPRSRECAFLLLERLPLSAVWSCTTCQYAWGCLAESLPACCRCVRQPVPNKPLISSLLWLSTVFHGTRP